MAHNLFSYTRRRFKEVLFYQQWGIGIVDKPIETFLTPGARPHVQWISASARTKYLADPFAIQSNRELHIFAEDFDYPKWKGCISTIQVSESKPMQSKVILDEPFHMSYPFLLCYKGEIYCIPETAQAKQVRLYRATNFPESWEFVGILIDGIAALDSTVIQYEGRWWLFLSDHEDGRNVKLKIWHADELFGPWKPHANNPVKMDIHSSRSAGTPFFYKGDLYRPSQDDFEIYGRRVIINRIIHLSTTDYKEEQAAIVEPYKNSPYPNGIHTISSVGGFTLIDGVRYLFIGRSFTMLTNKLKTFLTRMYSKLKL